MDLDVDFSFQKKRLQLLLFVFGIIALSITAEKCRLLVGEDASSKSGKFTLLNCFDMSTGTVACGVKEGVKLYFYNIRSAHVERARHQAIEIALADAMSQGLAPKDAAKQSQKEGAKASKLAKRQAKRIIGPIISSGWDFFEAIYYGGTMTEGFLRGTGTLFGAYGGGFIGEQKLGRFGYLVGSHLGSWVGGRIGLMVYDVVNGVHYLLQFGLGEQASETSEEPKDLQFDAIPAEESPEVSADQGNFEFPSFGIPEEQENYELRNTQMPPMLYRESNVAAREIAATEDHGQLPNLRAFRVIQCCGALCEIFSTTGGCDSLLKLGQCSDPLVKVRPKVGRKIYLVIEC